jgi:hypothetical protein
LEERNRSKQNANDNNERAAREYVCVFEEKVVWETDLILIGREEKMINNKASAKE